MATEYLECAGFKHLRTKVFLAPSRGVRTRLLEVGRLFDMSCANTPYRTT